MKKLVVSLILMIAGAASAQSDLPQLDQQDVLSFETDIVSDQGGRYEAELLVVATLNGHIRASELVAKGRTNQKKFTGSDKKSGSINVMFTVKTLQSAIANLVEKLGADKGRAQISLIFNRRFSTSGDPQDTQNYVSTMNLFKLKSRLREVSGDFPNASVWNLVSKVDDIEFVPGKVGVKVRHKVNALRMYYR